MNSVELYSKFSWDCSNQFTRLYSTSFSIGIRLFKKEYRKPIYALYGFVRMADEIVDSFHDFNKSSLLNAFKEDTFQAIEVGISFNPILQSFQQMVREYNLPENLIHSFLDSMAMDLYKTNLDEEEYNKYIFGSAEAIGLMCLYIFLKGNKVEYERLGPYAQGLGAAFQKINFLRDMKMDFEERGRVYFPGINLNTFNDPLKNNIQKDIQIDFNHGFQGIKLLPKAVQLGVFVAYMYYLHLFAKIKASSASDILSRRIRVSNFKKIIILVQCWMRFKLGVI